MFDNQVGNLVEEFTFRDKCLFIELRETHPLTALGDMHK